MTENASNLILALALPQTPLTTEGAYSALPECLTGYKGAFLRGVKRMRCDA